MGSFQKQFDNLSNKFATLLSNQQQQQESISNLEARVEDESKSKTELLNRLKQWETKFTESEDSGRRVVCLIDGDGNIFAPGYFSRARNGGRDAAQELCNKMREYISMDQSLQPPPATLEISIYVFMNKWGLKKALRYAGYIKDEKDDYDFDESLAGFNQSGPRHLVIDVGSGKEAADSKMRVFLQDQIRSRTTLKVFFGATHDGGYAHDLQAVIADGFKDKLVLLSGYKDVAFYLKDLNLPCLEIPGLFLQERLPKVPPSQNSSPAFRPLLQLDPDASESEDRLPKLALRTRGVSFDTGSAKRPYQRSPLNSFGPLQSDVVEDEEAEEDESSTAAESSRDTSGSTPPSPQLQPVSPALNQYIPSPCVSHYLNGPCKTMQSCSHGHDYKLSPQEIEELRQEAQQRLCRQMRNSGKCAKHRARKCPYGHQCPNGPSCEDLKHGNCDFPNNLHK